MKFDQLKAFYIVANAGSFTKAAEEMNVDQSSVSRKIIDLETRMKTKLFLRQARGLVLTKEGGDLLEKARVILSEIESMRALSGQSHIAPQGPLKIAASPELTSMFLMDYIPGFLENFPKMELIFTSVEKEFHLTNREADVAIQPFIPNAKDLVQQYLMTHHYYMYASPKYLDTYGMPKDPQDLDYHKLLIYSDKRFRPFPKVNWILKAGMPFGKSRSSALQCHSYHALLRAAQLGIGIISFPEESPFLQHAGLVKILQAYPGPEVDIYYIYPKELKASNHITCLSQYLSTVISDKLKKK